MSAAQTGPSHGEPDDTTLDPQSVTPPNPEPASPPPSPPTTPPVDAGGAVSPPHGEGQGPGPVVARDDDELLPKVTIPSLKEKRYRATFSDHHAMSWRLFVTVAVLAASMMLLLAAFAALTYPTPQDMAVLTEGATVDERVKAAIDARAAWSQQFITMSQTLLIGSLVPLLATITAYALGEKARQGRREEP